MKTAKQEYYERLTILTNLVNGIPSDTMAREVQAAAIELAMASFEYGRTSMKETYERNR